MTMTPGSADKKEIMNQRIIENNHGNGRFTYAVQGDCYSIKGADGIMCRLVLAPRWNTIGEFKTLKEAEDYMCTGNPVSSRVILEL